MPWTVDDVDRHKKGLSEKRKRQWVAIANAVLAKCLKDGGGQSQCDAKAIKTANGATLTEGQRVRRLEECGIEHGDAMAIVESLKE